MLYEFLQDASEIDLQKASGEDHYQLPVPAVILVGKDGKIQFIHVNPDYRQRLASKVILALTQSLQK